MSDNDKKPGLPLTSSVFANALASTPKYVDAGATAGMHNTLFCPNCGAARERAAEGALVCRYCGTALQSKPSSGGAK